MSKKIQRCALNVSSPKTQRFQCGQKPKNKKEHLFKVFDKRFIFLLSHKTNKLLVLRM